MARNRIMTAFLGTSLMFQVFDATAEDPGPVCRNACARWHTVADGLVAAVPSQASSAKAEVPLAINLRLERTFGPIDVDLLLVHDGWNLRGLVRELAGDGAAIPARLTVWTRDRAAVHLECSLDLPVSPNRPDQTEPAPAVLAIDLTLAAEKEEDAEGRVQLRAANNRSAPGVAGKGLVRGHLAWRPDQWRAALAMPQSGEPTSTVNAYSLAAFHHFRAMSALRFLRMEAAMDSNLSLTELLAAAAVYTADWFVPGQAPDVAKSAITATTNTVTATKGKTARGRNQGKSAEVPELDDLLEGQTQTDAGSTTLSSATRTRKPSMDQTAALVPLLPWVRTMTSYADVVSSVSRRPIPDGLPAPPKVDDFAFGPWYGDGSLGDAEGKHQVLPPEADERWRSVCDWMILGPCHRPPQSPFFMPETAPEGVVHSTGGPWTMNGKALACPAVHPAWRSVGPPKLPLKINQHNAYTPPLTVDIWTVSPSQTFDKNDRGVGGKDGMTTYARTVVQVPIAGTYWAAATADSVWRLRVNGEPAVQGPSSTDADTMGLPFRFTLALRAGANELLVQTDAGCWSLALGPTNGPRPLATAADDRKARVAERQQLTEPKLMGWRGGNSRGGFPDAKPVTAWDEETMTNIAWRRPLRGWSKASPVVVGDRVFVLEEPHNVVACARATGEVLWRRQCNVLELVNPEAFQRGTQQNDAYGAAQEALYALGGDTPQQIQTLMRTRYLDLATATREMEGMQQTTDKAWAAIVAELKKTAGSDTEMPWDTSWSGPWVGYSFATPVSDGHYLWVRFATGVAACFDLEGNRRWMVRFPFEVGNASEVCSPLLVDGLILLESGRKRFVQHEGEDLLSGFSYLVALEADTGRERWRAEVFNYLYSGSPVAMEVGDGQGRMTRVVVSAGGTVVRVRDGRVLIPRLVGSSGRSTPTVIDDILYRNSGVDGLTAHRLFFTSPDRLGAELLYHRRTCDSNGGLVPSGGLFHTLSGAYVTGDYKVIDIATGLEQERTVNQQTRIPGQGHSYVPPILIGDLMFICTRGDRHTIEKTYAPAGVSVLQSGRDGRLLARNTLVQTLTAHPVSDGSDLFLRNDSALYRMCVKGEDGARYEAEVNARFLLADLDLLPRPGPTTTIAALTASSPTAKGAGRRFDIGRAAYAVVDRPANDGLPGDGAPWKPVARTQITNRDGPNRLDLSMLGKTEGNTLLVRYSFSCPDTVTVRLRARPAATRIWMSGHPVAPGDRMTLAAGTHELRLRFDAVDSEDALLDLGLADSRDQEAEIATERAGLARCRPYLERAQALTRDTRLQSRIKSLLGRTTD